MSTVTVNESLHEREVANFENDVWAWLAPALGGMAGLGVGELGIRALEWMTGHKATLFQRVAGDALSALTGWLVVAGVRPTPEQWDRAKSERGTSWQSDLAQASQIALERSDAQALAFFGLPLEGVELDSYELEKVIARRRSRIEAEYSGAGRELLLKGLEAYAARVRELNEQARLQQF